MSKRLLFIFNPHSGKGKIKTYLYDITERFTQAGYEVTVCKFARATTGCAPRCLRLPRPSAMWAATATPAAAPRPTPVASRSASVYDPISPNKISAPCGRRKERGEEIRQYPEQDGTRPSWNF